MSGERNAAPQNEWQPIDTAPARTVVETKIDDENGLRNVAKLYRNRNLWWLTDGSMYVYYTPTHWREVPRDR